MCCAFPLGRNKHYECKPTKLNIRNTFFNIFLKTPPYLHLLAVLFFSILIHFYGYITPSSYWCALLSLRTSPFSWCTYKHKRQTQLLENKPIPVLLVISIPLSWMCSVWCPVIKRPTMFFFVFFFFSAFSWMRRDTLNSPVSLLLLPSQPVHTHTHTHTHTLSSSLHCWPLLLTVGKWPYLTSSRYEPAC